MVDWFWIYNNVIQSESNIIDHVVSTNSMDFKRTIFHERKNIMDYVIIDMMKNVSLVIHAQD